MEERRPEDSRQAPEVPGDDAVLVQVAAPKQIVDDEDQPAKTDENNDRREALKDRDVVSTRRLVLLPTVHEGESTQTNGLLKLQKRPAFISLGVHIDLWKRPQPLGSGDPGQGQFVLAITIAKLQVRSVGMRKAFCCWA